MNKLMILNQLVLNNIIDQKTFLECQQADDPLEKAYEIYLKQGLGTEKLIETINQTLDIEYINLSNKNISKEVFGCISEEIKREYKLMPFEIENGVVSVATYNFQLEDEIRNELSLKVYPLDLKFYYAFPQEIHNKIRDIKNGIIVKEDISDSHNSNQVIENEEVIDEKVIPSETVKKVHSIIRSAIDRDSSDIHIEPIGNSVRIRNRIDGDLMVVRDVKIGRNEYNHIVSRIKIMANLDPAEKRKSQDGKIPNYEHNGKFYDLRVSSMFVVSGEKIVIRLIRKDVLNSDLSKLGFDEKEVERIDKIMSKHNGIFLVTGETGSGKSTTVYTLLNILNNEETNICTVEDPVESEILGANQVQVNELADITFANALKTFLRQDPDIIMVGEIRDIETGEIAIKAANTGHFVLSTIHTNNSTATINRLLSMGIESYKISEGIVGVLSQRLIKKLCPHCKKEHKITPMEEIKLKRIEEKYNQKLRSESTVFYEPNTNGCPYCHKGFKGRVVVCEILEFNELLNGLIAKDLTSVQLRQEISTNTDIFYPFHNSAFKKAEQGIISYIDAAKFLE